MRSFRVAAPALLLITLMFATTLFAQEAAVDPQEQIDAAILTIKSASTPAAKEESMFSITLTRARATLLANAELAVPKLIDLLNENDVTIRLNAAILLTEIAKNAQNPIDGLFDALARCASDSNPGVSLQGFKGLMNPSVPESVRMEKLKEFLDPDMPRPIRMSAILQIDKMDFAPAIPLLVAHLQAITPSYKAQVNGQLTRTESSTPFPTNEPIYEEEEEEDALLALMQASQAGRSTSRRGGPAARTPAVVAQPEVKTYKIDPNTLSKREQEMVIASMEEQPGIVELHRTGLVLESLVAQAYPDAPLFGFTTTPPWQLESSVAAAVKWLQENAAAPQTTPS